MADVTVRRIDFGYFVRPAEETGTGRPRVEPCLGYVVDHPQGHILFDTGMGSHPEVDAHYRPRRVGLEDALAVGGLQIVDLTHVANSHLHFDHCGGNPKLGQIPVFVQGTELDAARQTQDYTLPELIEGSRFERASGTVEVLPGVFLIPTPGHTGGHQSLVVHRRDGVVVVAGQSHESATEYAADQLAWQAHRDAHGQPLPEIPEWIDLLQQFDPRMVFFAHDRSVWTPLKCDHGPNGGRRTRSERGHAPGRAANSGTGIPPGHDDRSSACPVGGTFRGCLRGEVPQSCREGHRLAWTNYWRSTTIRPGFR
jgi:N-acyl homoserine lactone hydrolase